MSEEPTYDWRLLAVLVPGADPEALNRELNGIYVRSLYAQMSERDPDAKTTKRQLQRLWHAFDGISRPAIRILVRQLREDLSGAGVEVPESVDNQELAHMLTGVIFRASLSKVRKAGGPKGIGAQARVALAELVELYCRHGCGTPYRDGGKWRRLDAIEFAAEVLHCWHLSRKSDTAESLVKIWAKTRPPPN